MAYVKTSSGLIVEEHTFAAAPAWANEEEDAPGRITYPADGTVVFTTATNAQYAYLVYNTVLADADEWVVRVKSKTTHGAQYGVPVCHCHDTAGIPSGAFNWATPPHRSVMRFFCAGVPAPITSVAAWKTTAVSLWTLGAFGYGNYYVFETVHGAVNDTLRYMLATDFTAYLKTGNYAHANTNDPWLVVGDGDTTYFLGVMVTDYIQVFDSLDVVVTNIEAGYTVKLFDDADVEQASGGEAGGQVTLDCSQVEFPLVGYFKVYDGGMVEARRLPTLGNFTGEALWGGDEWDGTPLIPPLALNTLIPTHGRIGTRVVLLGKNFGATQGTYGYGVEFHDGIAVADYVSWNDSEIVCLVPPGAATGEVEVV